MKTLPLLRFFHLLCVLNLLLLGSCAADTRVVGPTPSTAAFPEQSSTAGSGSVSFSATSTLPAETTPSPDVGQNPASASATESTALGSPTADLRRSPEDWRTWPVLPERVSERAREIYRQGLALGNDPHAFSVTGDCQAIREVLLGEFDDPRKYSLKPSEQALQQAIDWFQGSFNRNGAAVRGGFNAASVLSPIHADPQMCNPGETPLGCEFRIHNPSILIISLEVWNDRAHLERYELYLRQIIEYSIEEGVLPVLMTKADMAEALKHVINPLLVQLSYEYDLPLVNFWLAVQPLPNHGIDPARDGFHISEEAWWVKSLTAMKALDVVWRGVSQQAAPAVSSPTPTPTVEPVQPAVITTTAPSSTPVPICNPPGECVLFDFLHAELGKMVSDGIFIMDVNSGETAQVAGEGFRLQSVSPDGRWMLANQGSSLYRMGVTGVQAQLVTSDILDSGRLSAYWLDDENIILISKREGNPAIWRHSITTGEWQRLTGEEESPAWLYTNPQPESVFWESGVCTTAGECAQDGVWETRAGDEPLYFEGVLQPVFSPDGSHFAFMSPDYTFEDQFGANFRLLVEDLAVRLPSRRVIAFPAANGYKVRNRLESYTWSPDGSHLMIFLDERSYYYGKSAGYHTYLFRQKDGLLLEYDRLFGEAPRMAWAPEGRRILFAVTTADPQGMYIPKMSMLTPSTRITREYPLPPEWSGLEYRYIDRMIWLGDEDQ